CERLEKAGRPNFWLWIGLPDARISIPSCGDTGSAERRPLANRPEKNFATGPGLVLIIVRRRAGTTSFVVQPRRWVVERSLGWFGRWRRLSKDYEALPEVSEAMVTLAAIRLMLHRLAHPNRRQLPAP